MKNHVALPRRERRGTHGCHNPSARSERRQLPTRLPRSTLWRLQSSVARLYVSVLPLRCSSDTQNVTTLCRLPSQRPSPERIIPSWSELGRKPPSRETQPAQRHTLLLGVREGERVVHCEQHGAVGYLVERRVSALSLWYHSACRLTTILQAGLVEYVGVVLRGKFNQLLTT